MANELIKIQKILFPSATEEFALDILMGLSSDPKRVPPKYLYDERGSELFQKICDTEEYYPTRCESEILMTYSSQIAAIAKSHGVLKIVELGAGDGRKTKILLKELLKVLPSIDYYPIDISDSALKDLLSRFEVFFPNLNCKGISAEYFQGLRWLSSESSDPKLVLLLGGNLGNFDWNQSLVFLRTLWNSLNHGDRVLLGLDLKKDVEVLLAAYNDQSGATREFNLNLLERINRELTSNFDLKNFQHFGTYNVKLGAMESFLLSLGEQEVYISALNKRFQFKAFESIHTEYSFKYLPSEISKMVNHTGFEIEAFYFDKAKYFTDVLLTVSKE